MRLLRREPLSESAAASARSATQLFEKKLEHKEKQIGVRKKGTLFQSFFKTFVGDFGRRRVKCARPSVNVSVGQSRAEAQVFTRLHSFLACHSGNRVVHQFANASLLTT